MQVDLEDYPEDQDLCSLEPAMKTLAQDFTAQLNFSEEKVDEEIKNEDQEEEENEDDHERDEDDEETDDEDFSFVCDGVNATSLAAEETRLVFPLFNTDLLLNERLPVRPPVKHVYAETNHEPPVTSSSSGNDAISGPCCEWSKNKAVEAGGPGGCCKKSNSTGFSKLWRIKDFVHRSNSDGRDAFVFLNHPSTSKPKSKEVEKKSAGAVKVNGKVGGEKVTAQNKKKKSETVLAHERYLKSKAKDEDRRRSYLPYRPELVGFFTNVNDSLTRNVHPY